MSGHAGVVLSEMQSTHESHIKTYLFFLSYL
jgi:hypothetical protein